jgi:PadR family transcriptional regulator, regulatory protein PadR
MKYMTKDKQTQRDKMRPSIFCQSISMQESEILTCLSERKRYGIEILKAFEESSYGERQIHMSTLYTILSRLDEDGFIQSEMEEERSEKRKGGAKRKYFTITAKGQKQLDDMKRFKEKLQKWEMPVELAM